MKKNRQLGQNSQFQTTCFETLTSRVKRINIIYQATLFIEYLWHYKENAPLTTSDFVTFMQHTTRSCYVHSSFYEGGFPVLFMLKFCVEKNQNFTIFSPTSQSYLKNHWTIVVGLIIFIWMYFSCRIQMKIGKVWQFVQSSAVNTLAWSELKLSDYEIV